MIRVVLRSFFMILTPEIVEYDEKNLSKPAFDLIIGSQTMTELGIILDFKYKMITINEIKSPMRNINLWQHLKIKLQAIILV